MARVHREELFCGRRMEGERSSSMTMWSPASLGFCCCSVCGRASASSMQERVRRRQRCRSIFLGVERARGFHLRLSCGSIQREVCWERHRSSIQRLQARAGSSIRRGRRLGLAKSNMFLSQMVVGLRKGAFVRCRFGKKWLLFESVVPWCCKMVLLFEACFVNGWDCFGCWF